MQRTQHGRRSPTPSASAAFAPYPAAATLATALLTAAALLASCSSDASLVLRADASATLAIGLEVPQAIEAKLRSLSSAPDGEPMVSRAAVAAGAAEGGLTVLESKNPSPAAYRGSFRAADLAALADSSGLRSSGLLYYERGPGWASIRVRVDRSNAARLLELFPGVDPELLDALQPPALFDNPVSRDEYRSMLLALLGRSAAASLDAAAMRLSLTLPGQALERIGPLNGGGASWTLSIPLLDALTLEEPVEFFIKWGE